MNIRCDYPSPQCQAIATEAWERCNEAVTIVLGRTFRCDDHPPGEGWDESSFDKLPYDKDSWPVGPMVLVDGEARFRENKIVSWLLDQYSDLNTIGVMGFSSADYEHFMQLIGYSMYGFFELSTATDAVCEQAERKADAMQACQKEKS